MDDIDTDLSSGGNEPPDPTPTLGRVIIRSSAAAVAVISLMGLGALSTIMIGGAPLPPETVAIAADDSLASRLGSTEEELTTVRLELERAHQILDYSARYGIPADLTALIYDNAVAEGISPAVGFRLVKIESNFQNTAASTMSAIGLTQLQLATARSYEPTIKASDLMNSQINLRIGFRYLRDLLRQFDNDIALALEAYNKGPTLVAMQQAEGIQVKGRYSSAVLQNY